MSDPGGAQRQVSALPPGGRRKACISVKYVEVKMFLGVEVFIYFRVFKMLLLWARWKSLKSWITALPSPSWGVGCAL